MVTSAVTYDILPRVESILYYKSTTAECLKVGEVMESLRSLIITIQEQTAIAASTSPNVRGQHVEAPSAGKALERKKPIPRMWVLAPNHKVGIKCKVPKVDELTTISMLGRQITSPFTCV